MPSTWVRPGGCRPGLLPLLLPKGCAWATALLLPALPLGWRCSRGESGLVAEPAAALAAGRCCAPKNSCSSCKEKRASQVVQQIITKPDENAITPTTQPAFGVPLRPPRFQPGVPPLPTLLLFCSLLLLLRRALCFYALLVASLPVVVCSLSSPGLVLLLAAPSQRLTQRWSWAALQLQACHCCRHRCCSCCLLPGQALLYCLQSNMQAPAVHLTLASSTQGHAHMSRAQTIHASKA